MNPDATILFRTRVPAARLQRVEAILGRLGLTPSDAFNLLLAQIELREEFPLEMTTQVSDSPDLLAADQIGDEWIRAFGAY